MSNKNHKHNQSKPAASAMPDPKFGVIDEFTPESIPPCVREVLNTKRESFSDMLRARGAERKERMKRFNKPSDGEAKD